MHGVSASVPEVEGQGMDAVQLYNGLVSTSSWFLKAEMQYETLFEPL